MNQSRLRGRVGDDRGTLRLERVWDGVRISPDLLDSLPVTVEERGRHWVTTNSTQTAENRTVKTHRAETDWTLNSSTGYRLHMFETSC